MTAGSGSPGYPQEIALQRKSLEDEKQECFDGVFYLTGLEKEFGTIPELETKTRDVASGKERHSYEQLKRRYTAKKRECLGRKAAPVPEPGRDLE